MADAAASNNVRFRIRRNAGNLTTWFRDKWRESRWFRRIGYLLGTLLVLFLLVWVLLLRNLPSADKLLTYQPPLPTMVRGIDGQIVYSYARERRVQLRFVDFPKPVIDAFLSAEDKTFWTHGGVDYTGLAGAVLDYVTKIGSGERAKGGSTITQQVAKNILIGNEYSLGRKFKEMILAGRIESVLTKQQILELYLNEIPLGRQSFGVQAASRAYFGKDLNELQLHEIAFLAILPKAPERYGRATQEAAAIERRNWVLDQMVKNGWLKADQAAAAKAQPLGLIPRQAESYDSSVGYYVEEVRRRLVAKFGETAEDGPNSIYAGGLWIRTSLDPEMQRATQNALRAGLIRYHGGQGWKGPIAHVDLDPGKWQSQLITLNKSVSYKNWRVGMVLQRQGGSASIGFGDGSKAGLTGLPESLKAGDVVAAAPTGPNSWAVQTIPEVSGGMLVQSPVNGRILAMQGGFDSGLGSFNRATQAMRQPGSTIKPFVYATGLDFGMTPATQILDGPFCVMQGRGRKCFRNFGGGGGSGNHTMRWGLEQSRNLMTVRIADDAGMDNVIKTFDRVGIGKYQPYLAFSLGAGDTTVAQMVNAYAALANNGIQYEATVIDYVQDRDGKVIWRADNRRCGQCNMANWDGKPMPRLAPRGKQVMDPRTAYQVVHMLEGVVSRGTATVLRDLNLPMFGKTGTTSGPTNVWFVGGSQRYVGGVYLGFDKPRSLGGYAQGGRVAAPIFKEMVQATKPRWSRLPFVAPKDVHMVRIDRTSGKRVFGGMPGSDPKSSMIWEAFKAETVAERTERQEEFESKRDALIAAIKRRNQAAAEARSSAQDRGAEPGDFAEQQGGVY
ncbi:MAG: penicillin-binding protein 1A [Novosphingobium sp.]